LLGLLVETFAWFITRFSPALAATNEKAPLLMVESVVNMWEKTDEVSRTSRQD
jgi:hypothetical protein